MFTLMLFMFRKCNISFYINSEWYDLWYSCKMKISFPCTNLNWTTPHNSTPATYITYVICIPLLGPCPFPRSAQYLSAVSTSQASIFHCITMDATAMCDFHKRKGTNDNDYVLGMLKCKMIRMMMMMTMV